LAIWVAVIVVDPIPLMVRVLATIVATFVSLLV
jgi:hypothetical protein